MKSLVNCLMLKSKLTQSAFSWIESLLSERFGHGFTLIQQGSNLHLSLLESKGTITFDEIQDVFHESRSDFPCQHWQASSEGYTAPISDSLPAPSSSLVRSPLIELNEYGATVHYDILGLTYWMLTRQEEVGRTDLDEHGRFPATASHAYKYGYLERPIVDEWLHILGQVIERTWPGIELKKHQFSMKVSHDVDGPSRYAFRTTGGMLRAMAGDVLKRGDFKSALLAPWVRMNSKTNLHPADSANTFDWIMDTSERHGLTSAFYFICGRTDPSKDADYEPDHPAIRELMRRIHKRGHEIGLHPSYGSYQTPSIIKQEADRLRKIAAEEGIEQSEWGGRMHYLRWEQPTTLRAWADAGMTYDSTLVYADRPGFRCGTCFEYPAFDPVADESLSLRIRPLIAMETTIFAPHYLGLGIGEAALNKFLQLKWSCQAVGGCFTLLWHNSQLEKEEERRLYQQVLTAPLVKKSESH